MTRTLLVSGPARTGKSTLIQALAAEHPGHRWDLVQLEPADRKSRVERLDGKMPGSGGFWRMRYGRQDVLTALPGLIQQIQRGPAVPMSVIAFEAAPDPVLRHACAYNMRVFILPPMQDEAVLFCRPDQARGALHQILRDSSAFASELWELGPAGASGVPAPWDMPMPAAGGAVEVNHAQAAAFLAEPLGAELAVRVHLQPAFGAVADADIVILNTAAGSSSCEDGSCWRRLLDLLDRLRKVGGRTPLTYACDLSERDDPCFVRVRRRMSDVLCGV